jgi:hypothetical protein
MKKTTFFVGLVSGVVSGVVLSQTWRVLAKEGIKAGIKTGRKMRELSQQALEDLEDIAAEANAEVSQPSVSQSSEEPRW